MYSLSVSILPHLLWLHGKDFGSLSQQTASVLISQGDRKQSHRISQTVYAAAQRPLPGVTPYARGMLTSWRWYFARCPHQSIRESYSSSGKLCGGTVWPLRGKPAGRGIPGEMRFSQASLPPKLCYPLLAVTVPLAREGRERQGLIVLASLAKLEKSWLALGISPLG